MYDFVDAAAYKGITFRSTLEARWAAFFDLCGWRWAYEPDIGSKSWLPDFSLKGYDENFYVEVKPIDWQRQLLDTGLYPEEQVMVRPDLAKVSKSDKSHVIILGSSPFVEYKNYVKDEMVIGVVMYPDGRDEESPESIKLYFTAEDSGHSLHVMHHCYATIGDYGWGHCSPHARAVAYAYWKEARQKIQKHVVPFGKYKGKSWDILRKDLEYCREILKDSYIQKNYSLLCAYSEWLVEQSEKDENKGLVE